jgi:D-alanyl-lipoteichoic acid acyltransferase DltB (MBOAT superfamily)
MKPYRTLLLLSLVLILLFGPSFFIKEPVRIYGNVSFSFPPVPEVLSALFVQVQDTGSVNNITSADEKKRSGQYGPDQVTVQVTDTLPDPEVIIPGSTGDRDSAEPVPPANVIESFSSDSLWQNFLKSLDHPEQQVRVLYYGDSQIEEDRLTDSLRTGLRQISGGSGPGLLNITPVVDFTRTSWVKAGREWKRYNYLAYRRGEIASPSLGPMFSFSRFTSPEISGNEISSATVTISPTLFSDAASAWYNRLRLFYGNLNDTLEITLKRGRTIVSQDTLFPEEGIYEYSRIVKSGEGITISMKGRSSPDIYGISLESDSGIIVDNISGRGSAGLEFALSEQETLTKVMKLLEPDLIVMHYGLNLVRNNSASYDYYEDALVKQIEVIGRIVPGVPVLIMGVTDMAQSDTTGIRSYPAVSLIAEAQRNAAARGNALFWDSRRAMGGKNAVVRWRDEDPPLAAADYAHLTYQGAHRLAGMLLESILYDYRKASSKKEDNRHPEGLPENSVYDTTIVSGFAVSDLLTDKVLEMTAGKDLSRQTDSTASPEQVHITRSASVLSTITGYNPDSPLLFTAVSFWIFIFVLLAGYSLIYTKPFLRNGYLFFFSLFFYYKSGGLFFFLLLISTFTDYTAARIIHAAARKSVKRFFLVISLIVNLGMLAYFKYAVFLTGVVNELFNLSLPVTDWLSVLSNRHLGTSFDISDIILPVGISFFTFQTISYTMDIYRGRIKPVTNLADFGFYVSFFPQLVAGPIVRASEFVPQLYTRFTLSVREWGHALFLILTGLVKKVVVSDYIAVNMIDRVFSAPGAFSGLENLLAVYGYGLQIYCDFSGYTDIAIGVALMLGYRLPLNFNSPYKASSLTDFWRRWHISLSRWLRDYLYIPMGGNRKGRLRRSVNIIVTMLLGGLWHGAAWRFLAWGALHGVGMVIEKGIISLKSRGKRVDSNAVNERGLRGKLVRFFALLLTFNFVSFCWIFFRASGMENVKVMLLRISGSFMPSEPLASLSAWGSVLTVIGAGYLLHFLPVRVKEAYRGLFISLPLPVKILVTWLVGLALYNISMTGAQPFIYFRF